MSHYQSNLQRRTGFTLVELLAVVAVVATLIALLLPAVQTSRSAARRVQCLNNLRQVGLGLHSYHDTNGSFPHARDRLWWSWLGRVLPHVEEGGLYDQIDFSVPAWAHARNQDVAQSVVATFLCSADVDSREGSRAPQSDLVAGWIGGGGGEECGVGESWFHQPNPFAGFAFTNYLGVSGVQGAAEADEYRGSGMFPSSGSEHKLGAVVSFRKVTDGTSKTLFVGERPVSRFDSQEGDRHDLGWWATGHGWSPAPYGRADYILDSMGGLRRGSSAAPAIENATHWWSHHPAGSQFLLVDGSARMMGYETDQGVLLAISTRNGRELTTEKELPEE